MKTLYIGQDSILEHLNLSFGEFKRLLLTFDIRTILDKYTKNQFLLFREYLVKSGHTVGEMDESCFFEDIVIEKRQSLEELIRSRKKNHTPQYPADTIVKTTDETDEFETIKEEDIDAPILLNDEVVLLEDGVGPQEEIEPLEDTSQETVLVPRVKKENTIKTRKIKKDKVLKEVPIEITGIIGRTSRLIDEVSIKDKTRLLKNSYVLSRYELYCDDCKRNDAAPVTIEIYKKFKDIAPINHDFVFIDILRDMAICLNKEDGKIWKIKSAKIASKVYNNGFVLYYAPKDSEQIILCKLDTTKPFATNVSAATSAKSYGIYDFYTFGERFEPEDIIPVVTNIGKQFTPEEDERILAFYNSPDYADTRKKKNGITTLKQLAKEFNIDSDSIRLRAANLGFTNFKKPKEKNWSEAEYKLLEECAGKYNPRKIEKIFREHGYTRGYIAIGIKITRQNLSRLLDGSADMNLKTLSKFMGVEPHYFYDNNRFEKLMAYEENNQWIISKENVRNYLINNPLDYALRKVDASWFVNLLANNEK